MKRFITKKKKKKPQVHNIIGMKYKYSTAKEYQW